MSNADIKETLPPRLVVFDGVCNLCNASVQFIIRRDPEAKFMFTPLQSEVGMQVSGLYDLPVADFDSFIYIRDGKLYQRSTAALYVLKDLGGFWTVFYTFIIVPRPLRDLIYDLVARYRYRWFGRKDSCMVPTAALRSRFL